MSGTKFDQVCESAAARLIELIESGKGGAWVVPWRTDGVLVAPVNASTGNPYSGGNWILAVLTADERGYTSGQWATYKQWKGLGRQVAKGERGTRLAKWVEASRDDDDQDDGNKQSDGKQTSRRRFPVTFSVFAAEQLTEDKSGEWQIPHPPDGDLIDTERNATLDSWMKGTGAEIRHGGTEAYYRAGTADFINLPALETWLSWGDYYATSAHELIHWTGHESRLDREFIASRSENVESRAFEELVAEFGAAMVCTSHGVKPHPRSDHAGYLAHWADLLRADARTLWTAAASARRAAKYLTPETDEGR